MPYLYPDDIALQYERQHQKLQMSKASKFTMYFRPISYPIAGLLCWVVLYLKMVEILERILYKVFLTILIPVNDNIPFL